MSALDFLVPEPSVVGRSPMEGHARRAGARLKARDGWNVVVGYDGTGDYSGTVGFADRSWLRKRELYGGPGVALPPGVATRVGDAWWCPVTPTRTLVIGGQADDATALLTGHPGGTVVEVTCGLVAMSLIGPLAREALARFCAIDVRDSITPVGGFRPGSVARTPGYVLREGPDQLLLLVGWAFGEYLWETVADACGHLGGGPVA